MKLKNKRFFLEPTSSDVKSTVFLSVPSKKVYREEYEVTMRDCSRQIHYCFSVNRAGLAKVKKLKELFTQLQEAIESEVNAK